MSQNIFHHHSFSKTTHRLFLKRALPSVFKATFLEGELFTSTNILCLRHFSANKISLSETHVIKKGFSHFVTVNSNSNGFLDLNPNSLIQILKLLNQWKH